MRQTATATRPSTGRLLGGVLGAAAASVLLTGLAPAAHAAAPAATATGATAATGAGHVSRPAVKARPVAARAYRMAPAESRLLTLINAQRTSRHLVPVAAAAGATDVARRWSARLAQQGDLSHNPALVQQLSASGSSHWRFLAENIGVAPAGSTDMLFAAYMASQHHRANILDPRARFVGIGTVTDGIGQSWNTMDLSDSYDDHYGAARTAPRA